MRIALGGIAIESCTFSPLPSRLDDFTVRRGADFLDRYPFLADFAGRAEFVPLLYARALPGGAVEPGAYAALKAEYLDLLRANGPWDGVYLDFHGAMHVRDMDDAEGDWVTAVREVVGPACLLAASFDLHGNISEREAATLDMLTAYRTAPHVDYIETRAKALHMLLDCLDQQLRPERVWIPIPVVLPGEKTSTEWAPGDRLYAALAESDGAPGLLDISLLVGYVWADEPRTSATVIATGFDRSVLAREAQKVAQRYWDARHEFQFGVPAGTIDECIAWGLDAPEACVFISDSGDNPTAGGAGDTTVALAALIKHGAFGGRRQHCRRAGYPDDARRGRRRVRDSGIGWQARSYHLPATGCARHCASSCSQRKHRGSPAGWRRARHCHRTSPPLSLCRRHGAAGAGAAGAQACRHQDRLSGAGSEAPCPARSAGAHARCGRSGYRTAALPACAPPAFPARSSNGLDADGCGSIK